MRVDCGPVHFNTKGLPPDRLFLPVAMVAEIIETTKERLQSMVSSGAIAPDVIDTDGELLFAVSKIKGIWSLLQ